MEIRAGRRDPNKPPRLTFLTWDIGDVGLAGAIQKAETPSYVVWMVILAAAHRNVATIAKLMAALEVDAAEQVFHPSFMPTMPGYGTLRVDGSWHGSRGRTPPPWAVGEFQRVAGVLREQHSAFLEAAVKATHGVLGQGFRRPEPDFTIQDDAGRVVVAEIFPRIDVDLSDSDRVGRGLDWNWTVRLGYRRDRYMQHLSDRELGDRVTDLLTNTVMLNEQGLVGLLPPEAPLLYWMERFTEAAEELALRYGPFPGGFEEGRVRIGQLPGTLDRKNIEKLGKPLGFSAPSRAGSVGLVKYGEARYLRPALERGSFRVSPASAYQDPSLNTAVQDDELSAKVNFPVSALTPQMVKGGVLRQGTRLTVVSSLKTNFYVFCLSRALDLRLPFDFDSDCCLVIYDVAEFTRRLSEAVGGRLPGWSIRSNEVEYYDPLQVMPAQLRMPFSKHFRYAYQRERRLVWLPPKAVTTLDPLHVEIGSLEDIAELIVPVSDPRAVDP